MLPIVAIVPQHKPRAWQAQIIHRLEADNCDVAVLHEPSATPWSTAVNTLLGLERRLFRRVDQGLASPVTSIPARSRTRPPALCLDLVGNAPPSDIPTITLRFDRASSDRTIARTVATGGLPELEAVLDGRVVVGRAFPMIDRREATSLGVEDVLGRAVTLILSVVRAFAEGRLEDIGTVSSASDTSGEGFLAAYLSQALPRLGREALRRARYRQAHWRVGYRFIDGPGVAQTGRLGAGWAVLPDDGDRFYADPFAIHWQGRPFLFVEDYVHTVGKAVISVVPFTDDRTPLPPRVVLEEPHHLSYPQVFERDGIFWMLPEASSSGRLTLYRATRFPDTWQPAATLLEGEISDATLLDHGGSLWLFATRRDGYGSTSDTMVVFGAITLLGPWREHIANPILIDRRRARPGGAFIRSREGRLLLPVQDGTLGYGGGLGLSELIGLDATTVHLSDPRPILADGDWPCPHIHTLNRSGSLEVIDGIAAVPRWSQNSRPS